MEDVYRVWIRDPVRIARRHEGTVLSRGFETLDEALEFATKKCGRDLRNVRIVRVKIVADFEVNARIRDYDCNL